MSPDWKSDSGYKFIKNIQDDAADADNSCCCSFTDHLFRTAYNMAAIASEELVEGGMAELVQNH